MIEPTKPSLSQDELSGFNLVAICMALHHIKDPQFAISRLVERLRSNGMILVVDWATRDATESLPSTHPAAHTVTHDGFTKDQVLSLFQNAGCHSESFILAGELSDVPEASSGKKQLFFARATKV